ncbi:cytochrome P450 6a2-like [Chironomus tepperi]|uniref:cytochrome P450 6a2-like n=1 Tax=Chironomus tepperi TaxID=113505 RepID=UPI00391F2DC6
MALLSILFYVTIFILTGIYLFFKRQFSFFEKQNIPHLKPSIPFGNMKDVTRSVHLMDRMQEIFDTLKKRGKVIGFYNLTDPVYVITDVETIKHIVIKDFNNFMNRGVFVNEEEEPLTGHLFAIEDERWHFLRNKLSPVFTSGKLKHMYLTINDLAKNLVARYDRMGKNMETVEAKSVANRFTVDIISSVAFGMDANTLNDQHLDLLDIFKEIFGGEGASLLKLFFLFAFPNLSKKLHLRQFSKKICDFFINVVATNIKYREDTNDKRNDFLNMLIQLKNKGSIDGEISTESKKLTLNEILAQAFLFFFAGSDTSSTTMSFALTELAFNQEVQDKLRAELDEKTKDTNGEISYELLHEMTYLNQVVNETLRMHPPAPFIIRKAKDDYKVPETDVTIKKNTTLWIPMQCFHYDDRFWSSPSKFDPERFTAEEVAKRPLCYFPFGEGPRNCIGMRLGLMNVKVGVAKVIQNFKVTPDPKLKYPLQLDPASTSVEPIGKFPLKFERI